MSEAAIQKACVELLAVFEAQGKLLFFSVPNGAWLAGDDRQRAMLANSFKKQGMRPGVPDLCIVLPRGRMAFAELKSDTGRLSGNQEYWRDRLRHHGHDWWLVRSLDDLRRFLRTLGVS